MTREEVLERIIDPHGPPTDPAERREFDAWLERDAELRETYERQQALFGAMDEWSPAEPSMGFDRGVYAKIEAEQARRAGWRSWFSGSGLFGSWKPAMAAGLTATALLLGMFVWQPQQETPEPLQYAVKTPPMNDAEYLDEIDRALDDMEMLADFDAFLAESAPEGRS